MINSLAFSGGFSVLAVLPPVLPILPTSTDVAWYKFAASDVSGASVKNWVTGTSDANVLVGAPTVASSSVALGTNKYIKLPSVNLTNSTTIPSGFTICMWVNIATTQTANCNIFVLGNNNSYSFSAPYSIIFSGANCYLTMAIGGGGTGAINSTTRTAASMADGNWHMHTMVIPATGNVTAYYDGVLWGTSSNSGLTNETTSVAGLLAWGPWYINAAFSDIRMYKKTLTAANIQKIFQAGRVTA